jgi:hypothetical protein
LSAIGEHGPDSAICDLPAKEEIRCDVDLGPLVFEGDFTDRDAARQTSAGSLALCGLGASP